MGRRSCLLRWIVGGALAVRMAAADPAGNELRILCTTFPMHQFTRQVVRERSRVTVELLLPASLGCPHHYALTPRDMRRLAEADVLVVNGLGLEEFLGAPVARANPRIRLVDASQGIGDLIRSPGCAHAHAPGEECRAGTVNPHLFASPRMAAKLTAHLAEALAEIDPGGADAYRANAKEYGQRMIALAEEMRSLVELLPNRRIVQPHGVFDYLARDIGLDIVAVIQSEGQEPSAAEMLALIRTVRELRAAALFTEPQYASRVGQRIAQEAGIPADTLDPVASGPDDAPPEYYEQVMRRNLETLRRTLTPP